MFEVILAYNATEVSGSSGGGERHINYNLPEGNSGSERKRLLICIFFHFGLVAPCISGLTHQTNITNDKFWADDRILAPLGGGTHLSIHQHKIYERFDLHQVGLLSHFLRNNSRQT